MFWIISCENKGNGMNHILDVSNLLYRGLYGITTGDYGPSFYVLDTIETIMNSDEQCKIFLCLDGFPEKKKELYKEYKGNREHKVSVYDQLPALIYYLKNINNIHILFNPKAEADDLIYTLSLSKDEKNIIYSTDNDLFQCLNANTAINTGKEYITIDNLYSYEKYVKTFFCIPPERIVLYRAIVGDQSDNIKPCVPRFPHKLASVLAKKIDFDGESCPSLESMKECCSLPELSESEKIKINNLITSFSSFEKSFEIMKLRKIHDFNYSYKKESCTIVHHYILNKIIRIKNKLGVCQ